MNRLFNYVSGKPPSKTARDNFKAALKRYFQIKSAVDLGLVSITDPAVKEAFTAMKDSFNKEFIDEL